jgi:hypothetical protein
VEPGFFIKLTEIPDLASKLEDPEFNERLRTDPASVFADYGIDVPEGLIPETVELPSVGRIAEIKDAMAVLAGQGDEEQFWFWFVLRPDFPLSPFPFPWFPWFRRGGGESA